MTDDKRFTLETPLGPDAFGVHSFTGREMLSGLFHFQVELLSEAPDISIDRLLGKPVTLRLPLADNKNRYINGIVSQFTRGDQDNTWTIYRAEIVPWLWLMTLRQDCRIFQDMTVPDILIALFDELGFYDYKNALTESYAKLDYCVQYQETDFNFISRLIETHGIFYYFTHEQNRHTLILGDAPSVHSPCPGQAQARYAHVLGDLKREDMITAWQMAQTLRPGTYAMTDYFFQTPQTHLATRDSSRMYGNEYENFEHFIYPGGYHDKAQGERLVQLRREEEAGYLISRGKSTCRAFSPGFRFHLTEHDREDMNTAYLLTEVRHEAAMIPDQHYANTFMCMPMTAPYRPPCQTPVPKIHGPQTAFVVGPEGDELYVDQYGRVKVQFLWDRKGQWNERSSCWLRVSQPWAGTQWGAIFLPRIGQEVVVNFLDGNPDRPIITGRVYNAQAMPPMALPAHQEWCGIMSKRLGGGDANALLMRDHKSEGQVVLQSYGDMDTRTQRDKREWTGNNHDELIKGSYNAEVSQSYYLRVDQEMIIDVRQTLTLKTPGGFIKIDPSGITIQGTMVQINSGGTPGIIPASPIEAQYVKPGQVDR